MLRVTGKPNAQKCPLDYMLRMKAKPLFIF